MIDISDVGPKAKAEATLLNVPASMNIETQTKVKAMSSNCWKLLNTKAAAKAVADSLRCPWDGCNAINYCTTLNEQAFDLAISLADADYCLDGDICLYQPKLIPPPLRLGESVEWYSYVSASPLDIIPMGDSLIPVFDETSLLWAMASDKSVGCRTEVRCRQLNFFQVSWKFVHYRRNLFQMVKSTPGFQIGADGPELIESPQYTETLSMNDREMAGLRVLVEEQLRVADLWDSS